MIKNKSAVVTSAVLTVLLGAAVTFAQSETKGSTAQTSTKKTAARVVSDTDFAKMAAAGGLAEVKLGQLAEDKGTAQDVKDFGRRMVMDHTKIDDTLKTATSKENITLPSEMNAKDQAVYNRLSKLSGSAFDRAYARDMVSDHTADIAEFRQEANNGKDASIKGFANQTLPTLQDHLKQAREMLHNASTASSNQTKKSTHSS